MCASLLNIFGLGLAFLGTFFLALRFGITFHGDSPGVNCGKHWTKLGLNMQWGQRICFALLAIGFILQLISQLL